MLSKYGQMSSQLTTQADEYSQSDMPFYRRLRAGRRIKRAIQGYARRRQLQSRRATTSQATTLTTLRRSYRRGNPMSVRFSNNRQIDFWRTASFTWTMNQNTGFNGFGQYLGFDFSLSNILGYHSAGFQWAITVPNSGEFVSLFDYYCIKCVKMTFYYSHNTSTTNHPAEPLPLFLVTNDYDDAQGPETLTSMNERSGVRRIQMGNTNDVPPTHWCKPCAVSYTTQTDPVTGTQSSINAGITRGTQWLNLAANVVRHSGTKLYWDTQGRTGVTDMGNLTITFEVCYTMAGWR